MRRQATMRRWRANAKDADGSHVFGWSGMASSKADAEKRGREAAALAWRALLDGLHVKEVPLPDALFVKWTCSKVDTRGIHWIGVEDRLSQWTIGMTLENHVTMASQKAPGTRDAGHEGDVGLITPYFAECPWDACAWGVRLNFAGEGGVRLRVVTMLGKTNFGGKSDFGDALLAVAAARWAAGRFHMGTESLVSGDWAETPPSATLRAAKAKSLKEERDARTLRLRLWLSKIGQDQLAQRLLGE